MYKNKKICFITGSRAEYGLLQLLIKKVNSDKDLKLQIIATGMHLSERFGYTFKEIEEDGFFIDSKVEMLQSSDSELDLVKAISVGMEGFSKVIAKLKPDLIIVYDGWNDIETDIDFHLGETYQTSFIDDSIQNLNEIVPDYQSPKILRSIQAKLKQIMITITVHCLHSMLL